MNSRGEDTSDTSAGVARDGSAHFVGRSGLAGRALHFDFARKRVRVADVFESGACQIALYGSSQRDAAFDMSILGPRAKTSIGERSITPNRRIQV